MMFDQFIFFTSSQKLQMWQIRRETKLKIATKLVPYAFALKTSSSHHSQYLSSPHSSLDICFGTDKENLFNNQSSLGWQSFPLFS